MKILSIGEHITHKKVSNAEFRSPVSFFDFDMVILNPSTIFSEYEIDIFSPNLFGLQGIE